MVLHLRGVACALVAGNCVRKVLLLCRVPRPAPRGAGQGVPGVQGPRRSWGRADLPLPRVPAELSKAGPVR